MSGDRDGSFAFKMDTANIATCRKELTNWNKMFFYNHPSQLETPLIFFIEDDNKIHELKSLLF